MSLTSQQQQAIFKLYPQVITINGDEAFDTDGNEVTYDINSVNAKVAKDESDKLATQQAELAAKESALSKLTALGLTQDEVKAIIGQ